jgi:hypothetical protein
MNDQPLIGIDLIRPHRYAGVNYPAGQRLLFAEIPMDEATAWALIGYVATPVYAEPAPAVPPEAVDAPVATLIAGLVAAVQKIAAAIYGCAPVGMVARRAGPPRDSSHWLVCDGRNMNIHEHPALHAVIGGRFGYAPAGQFRLPAEPFATNGGNEVMFHHVIRCQ